MLKNSGGVLSSWEKICLLPSSTIREAVKNLDESALQIVIVVDDEGAIVGTVSDGDIRRGLLRGRNMSSKLSEILFASPLVAPESLSLSHVEQLMRANKIRQIPIVDVDRKVTGLHLWDEITKSEAIDNKVFIMAGGLGQRLMPLTAECPKPMLRVSGRPILEHIISRAKEEGFRDFLISVNHLAHVIEDYFLDGAELGVNIEYIREESPLGTAGSLSLIDSFLSHPIVVSNGDVMSDVRFKDVLAFHVRHQADATMAIRPFEMTNPYGVVRTEGLEIVGLEEKPVFRSNVNAGVYVFSPDAVRILRKAEACDMPELFLRLKEKKLKVIAYPMHEPWLDVGRVEDLERAESISINEESIR